MSAQIQVFKTGIKISRDRNFLNSNYVILTAKTKF